MHCHIGLIFANIVSIFVSQTLCFLTSSTQHYPLDKEYLSRGRSFLSTNVKQVAIIGAGPAGSSTAYHLRQFANKAGFNVNITIFERNSYVGGRVSTVNVYNDIFQPTELGSVLFVGMNPILKNATEKFGLTQTNAAADDAIAVWDGINIIFVQDDKTPPALDLIRVLLRYGIVPVRHEKLKKDALNKVLKLYEYPSFPFQSLTNKINDLGLTSFVNVTGIELLDAHNIKGPFVREIILPSTRVAYGQSPDTMHGLQTLVSMSVEGAISIKGGNSKIFEEMIKDSNSTVVLNTNVTNISTSTSKKGYNISWINDDHRGNEHVSNSEYFDSVVLAAPLEFSNITLEPGMLEKTPKEISYVRLHVTLFTSPHKLDPAFFNFPAHRHLPATIITTLPPLPNPHQKIDPEYPGFLSISYVRPVLNPFSMQKENLYKIYSLQAVEAPLLSRLLNTTVASDFSTSNDTISWFYPHVWEYAYPYANPREEFDDSELARDLWYTSGIESFISTMETSALMGMNVARLIVDKQLSVMQNRIQPNVYQMNHQQT